MLTNHVVYNIVPSPIGELLAGATPLGVCLYEFYDRGGLDRIRARVERRHAMEMIKGTSSVIDQAEAEMREYFDGKRKEFSLPLDLKGTPFELRVWNELLAIPYGETRSYGNIATKLGKRGAARAVGRANGSNYIPIIVPCHRVIQEDGTLRGYGGGLWRKKYLLDLERANSAGSAETTLLQERFSFSE